MSKTYDVTVRVPAAKVAVVLQTLEGEGELISALPTQEEERIRRPRVVVRNRKTGVLGKDLVLQVAAGGAETERAKFDAAFLEKGFAPGSVGARLNEAIRDGSLVEVRGGVYRIAPKTRRKGAPA